MPHLDKSPKKYICPKCERKSFVIYLTDENKEINSKVGRCDREDNCSYHYTPREYYSDNGMIQPIERTKYTPPPPKPTSYIDIDLVKRSLTDYDNNNFITFLKKRFGEELTTKATKQYFIGTSKRWKGANIFYQFDEVGKCRTGKIMLYNAETGKRVKEPTNCIDWLHTKIDNPSYNLNQCLFGSNLLREKAKAVNIVESEKTAVICSIIKPQYIWLATGGKENFRLLNASSLKGRKVTLCPDLGAFDKWSVKAKELNFKISDYLERIATPEQKEKGEDLADFLLREPFSVVCVDSVDKNKHLFFSVPEPPPPPPEPITLTPERRKVGIDTKLEEQNILPFKGVKNCKVIKADWRTEIEELQKYFDSTTLLPEPIKLNQCTTINDVSQFIKISLIRATANNGNPFFRPEIDRLIELKNLNELILSK